MCICDSFDKKSNIETKYISGKIQKDNIFVTLHDVIENVSRVCYILATGCDMRFTSKEIRKDEKYVKN